MLHVKLNLKYKSVPRETVHKYKNVPRETISDFVEVILL